MFFSRKYFLQIVKRHQKTFLPVWVSYLVTSERRKELTTAFFSRICSRINCPIPESFRLRFRFPFFLGTHAGHRFAVSLLKLVPQFSQMMIIFFILILKIKKYFSFLFGWLLSERGRTRKGKLLVSPWDHSPAKSVPIEKWGIRAFC